MQEATQLSGGTATIAIMRRTMCADKSFSRVDVLLSRTDGMVVVDNSVGRFNLGQRAARQNRLLGGGAPANPQHITEWYVRSGLAKRIDGGYSSLPYRRRRRRRSGGPGGRDGSGGR